MKLFLIIILLSASALGQIGFAAKTVSILDADTINVQHTDGNLDRVRLLGLDSPEVAHSSKEISQPYGETCKAILTALIGGKEVFVETSKRDSYGRNLGRIMLGEIDVNLVILQQGCGWLFYPNVIPADIRPKYVAAFIYAQTNRVGLFAAKKVQTPAKWRARRHLKPVKKVKK